MKSSRILKNKMRPRSLQREQASDKESLRGGRCLIFVYPLFRFSVFFHSVDHSPENRDLKSNPLLVGDLASHFEIFSKKFFFPEKGAGVFKESSVLLNSFGKRKKAQKSA